MEQYWNTHFYVSNNLPIPMWVVGYIDSYGAINAKMSTLNENAPSHTLDLSKGHRWRWNIPDQEWMAPRGCSELTEEELFLVTEWLINHGYAYPDVNRKD